MVPIDCSKTRNLNLVSLQRVMEEEEEKRLLLFLFRYLTIKKEETNQLHRRQKQTKPESRWPYKTDSYRKNYNNHFISELYYLRKATSFIYDARSDGFVILFHDVSWNAFILLFYFFNT